MVIVGVSNTQLGPFCGAFFFISSILGRFVFGLSYLCIIIRCKYNMYIGGLHIHRYIYIYIYIYPHITCTVNCTRTGVLREAQGSPNGHETWSLDELGRWSSYPIRFGLLCRLWSQACDSCDCGKRVGQTRCQEAP